MVTPELPSAKQKNVKPILQKAFDWGHELHLPGEASCSFGAAVRRAPTQKQTLSLPFHLQVGEGAAVLF